MESRVSDSLPKGDVVREFGAVGEHELDCCTCVTEGKPSWGVLFRSCGPCRLDMGRFVAGHGACAVAYLTAVFTLTGFDCAAAFKSLPALSAAWRDSEIMAIPGMPSA